MKTKRRFGGSWVLVAIAATIVVCDIVRSQIVSVHGFRVNPFVAGFIAAGVVAAFAVIFFEGVDLD